MSWNDKIRPLVVIVGPTAVGKTWLSIELAGQLSGEIISADSRYFYKGMDIGTAKPTQTEMKNITHHLINVASIDETWSLAKFTFEAQKAILKIHAEQHLPLLVGGSGQYIRAVVDSWQMPPQIRDDSLRSVLEKAKQLAGRDILYLFLQKVDPEAAKEIDPRNVRRTLRAVEVILKTGHLFSSQRQKSSSIFTRKTIGLIVDRNVLYQRIDQRIEKMLANGFVDEVKSLIDQGYSPDLSSMSAIGYREICAYLNGKMSLDEAIVLMKRNTRQFVRRQSNWFRKSDPAIRWFQQDETNIDEIIKFIQSDEGWLLPGE